MHKLKISIVTPSFNSARFIEDCIKSVVNQGYPDYEHVIIDGGSTDKTLEILRRYPQLKWISEPDQGQSDALNKGFKMATGDIIGWLNSDDVYLPNTFDKVAKYLSETEYDAVYSNLFFSDENLKVTRELRTHEPVRWLSLFHCFIPSATFFFRRRIIDGGIKMDEGKHITMDKEFFANILFNGYRIGYVDDFFSVFRWHAKNKSLDSREVTRVRTKEGIELVNKYWNTNIPNNRLTQALYFVFDDYILKIYRAYLKYQTKAN